MKISKAGIYPNIPMSVYHSADCCVGPSTSSSELRTLFFQSPAHAWCRSPLNPKRVEQEESAAFILGRAAHHLLLGEDAFSTLFIARPEKLGAEAWHGNKTICKNWLKEQAAAGRTVLTPDQIEQIRGMARSLSVHPLVKAGILNGEIEQSLIWQDKATGIWLKARPDAIPNDSGDYADLKTTSFIGEKLDRQVFEHGYDVQAALIKWGAKTVLGIDMASFSFVFVEKDPPHCVDVLTLGTQDIEEAQLSLRTALDTFAWCLKNDNWFGPGGTQMDARFIRKPEWAATNAQYRGDMLRREIDQAEEATKRYSAAEYLTAG